MEKFRLNIAGLNIVIGGDVDDYTHYRFRDYEKEGNDGQIEILYRESENIETPEGNSVATNDYRIFLEDENSYINYDVLENPCINTALIKSDKGFEKINAYLCDVEQYGGASLPVRCFNMLGEIFKYILIKHNGFVVHSSSISYKGNGILFSAPSGTGKSTHTGLWQKVYEDVEIINDDMPAVRKIDGVWHLCGTPWSGKSEKNKNECVPLRAIVFLERGETNYLEKLDPAKAVFKVLNQTLLPVYKDMMSQVMDSISDAFKSVPCYILKCNISDEAPKTVKEGVFGEN